MAKNPATCPMADLGLSGAPVSGQEWPYDGDS